MPSEAVHIGDQPSSRLTATIIALIAVACVLAAVFIYLQTGQRVEPLNNVLTAEAKAQYVSEMQAVVQSQPAIPADQKAALIQAMAAKLQANQ
jgi:hypothetical protein